MAIRIAYITYEYPPDIYAGGIATYVYEAARMMTEAGWDVTVFTGSFTRNEESTEDGVKIYRILITDVPDFKIKVADVFATVHTTDPFDLYETPEINSNALLIANRFPGLPFVTKLHTPLELQTRLMNYYKPFGQKLRFVLGALRQGKIDAGYWRKPGARKTADNDYQMTIKATAVSSPSLAMKKWVVEHWNIPKQIELLPNIFSPAPELLAQNYSTERKLLTFIGKINIQKGMIALMHALPYILEKCPGITVCLIGGDWRGPAGEDSMQAIMEKRLFKWKDRIRFTGSISREEIYKYLDLSVACIFPSIWEAFGYVALEAMSAGVPVIVSKDSGFNEITAKGKYGVVADPFSPADIAQKTVRLLNDKMKLMELSNAGRVHVLENYTRAALRQAHVDFYNKLIA